MSAASSDMPDVKITGSGCWAYECLLCHSVTFSGFLFVCLLVIFLQ